MTVNRLFTIGKIIQVRDNPLTINRLVFVETEEHIRHVVEVLNWLYPDASQKLRRAAELHDIGKKIYLRWDFARNGRRWDLRLRKENLLADFYQEEGIVGTFAPAEAMMRYLFLLDHGYARCFVVRQNPRDDGSSIVAARYQLDPPFGNHASSVELEDLKGAPDDGLNYVHSLIQLHHNFQVDKLVTAAGQHGEQIIADLYRLMTADQEGSRWAEYLVQKLEGGVEQPYGTFGFSEFAVEPVAEPMLISRNGEHVQGQVTLKAIRRPCLGERRFVVEYYVADVQFDPAKLLDAKKKGARKT